MQRLVAVLVATALISTGCAYVQMSQAKAQYEAALTPLLGKKKHEVLMTFGAPTSTRSIAGFEIWDYSKSYGMRARQNTFVNAYGATSLSGLSGLQTWEAYDQLSLYFDGTGTFVKWDGYVQR